MIEKQIIIEKLIKNTVAPSLVHRPPVQFAYPLGSLTTSQLGHEKCPFLFGVRHAEFCAELHKAFRGIERITLLVSVGCFWIGHILPVFLANKTRIGRLFALCMMLEENSAQIHC